MTNYELLWVHHISMSTLYHASSVLCLSVIIPGSLQWPLSSGKLPAVRDICQLRERKMPTDILICQPGKVGRLEIGQGRVYRLRKCLLNRVDTGKLRKLTWIFGLTYLLFVVTHCGTLIVWRNHDSEEWIHTAQFDIYTAGLTWVLLVLQHYCHSRNRSTATDEKTRKVFSVLVESFLVGTISGKSLKLLPPDLIF